MFRGKVISTKLVIQNLAQLKTRNANKATDQQSSRDS